MIAVGVDTHKERHYATALDLLGQLLGEFSFAATAAGYAELQRWAEDLGDQGSSSLASRVPAAGASVCANTCDRPVTPSSRSSVRGERSVPPGSPTASTRSRPPSTSSSARRSDPTEPRDSLGAEALLNVRRSTIAERTRLLNQLQALNVTAPVAPRERIGDGTGKQLERRIMSLRARAGADVEERAVFGVMRDLAARSRALAADARRCGHELAELVRSLVHTLLDEPGIRPISAAKLLASDPARFKHEAAFARCNGTAPLPASSGKSVRHRLNRGGDRPSRQRHPHHRAHPRQAPTRDARLPRPPHQRGKDQARSDAGAQTPHLPRHLQTARRSPLDFKEASLTHDAGAQSAPAALLRSWRAAVTRPLSRSMPGDTPLVAFLPHQRAAPIACLHYSIDAGRECRFARVAALRSARAWSEPLLPFVSPRSACGASRRACAHEPPNRSVHGLKLDPHCVGIRLGRIRDPELVQRVEQLDAIGA
jgi:transposase